MDKNLIRFRLCEIQLCSNCLLYLPVYIIVPVPVAARSKAWVCGRLPAEIVGSNPTGGMDVCLL